MGESSPEATSALLALLVVAATVFIVTDLVIAGLWIAGDVRRRPYLAPTWSVAHVFLALQVVLFAVFGAFCDVGFSAGLLSGSLGKDAAAINSLLPAMVKQQVALIAAPLLLVCLRYGGTPQDLGIPTPVLGRSIWRKVGLGVGLAVLLIPISDLIETLSSYWLLESGKLPYAPQLRELTEQMSATQILDQLRHQPVALIPMVLIIGIIGPIAEEVFFRGFAYRALKQRFGLWPGVVLSGLFFAAIHGNPAALLPIFFIGMVLAVVYERTGNLAAPIGLHCANNLLVVLLYFVAPKFSMWGWLFGRS